MFLHYLKIAFRNMRKYKNQSLVGIFGLAVSFALFVLGSYWLRYEKSYDMFYPDAERIRLMFSHELVDNKWPTDIVMPVGMADELVTNFPEIESAARCFTYMANYAFYSGENYIASTPYFVDTDFIDMFTLDYLEGNKQEVLEHWNSTRDLNVILTESIARKFFGNEPAKGNILTGESLMANDTQANFTVLAVVRDIPQNSNFRYNVLISMPLLLIENFDDWNLFYFVTYVKLKPHINEQALRAKLKNHMVDREWREHTQLDMAPLGDIHKRFVEEGLHLRWLGKTYPIRFGYIIAFVVAATLIILCAFINFMTLSLSRFMEKVKGQDVRRVFGAGRVQLNMQLLTSLGIEALLALFVSTLLVMVLTPVFSSFVFLHFRFGELAGWLVICFVAGLVFTMLMGLFPVHVINAMRVRVRGRNTTWRKLMVTVQLFIGVLFIFSVMVASRQFSYLQNSDLGFDRKNIVEITKPENVDWSVFKTELEANPNILETTIIIQYQFFHQRRVYVHDSLPFNYSETDVNFIDFFNIKLQAGEFFNAEHPHLTKVVINQTAARVMGFDNPVGQFINIEWGRDVRNAQIIGVVNDFHVAPLKQSIEPMIFTYPRRFEFESNVYIKVHPAGIPQALEHIQTVFDKHKSPKIQFSYQFLDDEYARFNRSEQAMVSVLGIMAVVCVLISLFGIYSMIALSTQHRRKEIAVRKVFGAETIDIAAMFIREYFMMVLIANVVAQPVVYWLMNRWLENYAYRVNIAWWMFAAVLTMSLVVVLATVLGQVLKAANENPADVVKSE